MSGLRLVVLGLGATILLTGSVCGDDDRANAAYGEGVRAYFNGQLAESETALTQAIDEGTADPRPHYFRGVVRQLLGQDELSLEDFQQAAKMELSPVGRSFDVAAALERVQGPIRMKIEEIRRDAIVQAKKLAAEANRSGRRPRADRGRAPLDPKTLPDVSQIVDATIPFEEISAKPYFAPVKTAAEIVPANVVNLPQPSSAPNPAIKPTDDPFNTGSAGSNPAPAEPPAEMPPPDQPAPESDPFDSKDDGGDAAPAEQPPPAEKKSESPEDDPFGGG